MVEKVLRDLKTILSDDLYKDSPFFDGLDLVIWTNTTANCKPVLQTIKLDWISNLSFFELTQLLVAMDAIFPISSIIVKGYKIYRVTKTEEFMFKKCEGKDNVNC